MTPSPRLLISAGLEECIGPAAVVGQVQPVEPKLIWLKAHSSYQHLTLSSLQINTELHYNINLCLFLLKAGPRKRVRF